MLNKQSIVNRHVKKLQPIVVCPFCSKVFKTRDQMESEKLEKGIRESIIEMIKKREEKVRNGEEDSFGSDFLGVLLKAQHDANINQRITIEDLVDECKTFYFAGQETTNSLLGWTMFLLAVHTDWQERARKEVLDLFGKQNPDTDGITKLKSVRKLNPTCLNRKTITVLIFLLILFSIFLDSHADELDHQ